MKAFAIALILLLTACATEPTDAPNAVRVEVAGPQVKGVELTSIFSGKAIRTRYLHSNEEFTYELFGDGKARRTRVAGGFIQQDGTWLVQKDQLCMRWPSAHLCYVVRTAGEGYQLTRQHNATSYSEISGKPIEITAKQ